MRETDTRHPTENTLFSCRSSKDFWDYCRFLSKDMMLSFKNPLIVSLLLFILLSSMMPTSSSSSSSQDATIWLRARQGRSLLSANANLDKDEDYENLTDDPVTSDAPKASTHPNFVPPRCNLCQDQQESCQHLASPQGCSCPGMTGPHEPPDPPHLRRVAQEGSGGGVVVRWCAPASVVTGYVVRVGDRQIKVDERRRLKDLGEVEVGAEVCVLAENRAGVSQVTSHSCLRFEPQNSESRLAVKLGVIGGVVALVVMVLVLVLVLWRLRTRRKSAVRGRRVEGEL